MPIAKIQTCGFAEVALSCICILVNITSSYLDIWLFNMVNISVSHTAVFWKGQHCASLPTSSFEGFHPAHTVCSGDRPRKPCAKASASVGRWLALVQAPVPMAEDLQAVLRCTAYSKKWMGPISFAVLNLRQTNRHKTRRRRYSICDILMEIKDP